MLNRPAVFLLVTIPTHLRVLKDVADLLQLSGQYTPTIIYYPSAVFDQNHDNCQREPHEAYIWTGSCFLSRTDYLSSDWRINSSPYQQTRRGISRWLPNKGIYRRLVSTFRFLPAPADLVKKVRRVMFKVAIAVRFFAGAHGLVWSALNGFVSVFKRPNEWRNSQRILANRSWLQRFLLKAFAAEWDSAPSRGLPQSVGFRQRLTRLFNEGTFGGLHEQKSFYEGIYELIRSQEPAMVILPEANLFYNSHFVIRAAHLNTTPVAIIPFTIVNTLEWAEAFFDVPLYQAKNGWNRIFARAFPHWVLEHKGRRLILPPVYILACEYFDMVPAVPWLINSGDVDAIAAESQFMSDYYLRAGIQKDKIHFTGALSDDKLFSSLLGRDQCRRVLEEHLGIQIREKVILIGLPPDQFAAGKRDGCEFDSYEELIRFMVGVAVSVSGSLATVLINLHPRTKHADVVWLASLGATIIDEPVERLVPLADVYVAVASATIRLGVSCGIPVVNYDAYQYDYDDYKGLAGVCEVKSKHDYENVLRALIHDGLFYSKIHAAQKTTASNLCLVDGKAGERLLNLFDRLTSSGVVA